MVAGNMHIDNVPELAMTGVNTFIIDLNSNTDDDFYSFTAKIRKRLKEVQL